MHRTIAAAVVSIPVALACTRPARVTTAAPMQCEQLATVKLDDLVATWRVATRAASDERRRGGRGHERDGDTSLVGRQRISR